MKYIYADNFRGFSDTIIPIADVNFLVGENSSGKTSFLTMLRMLSGSVSKAISGSPFSANAPDLSAPDDSIDGINFSDFLELVSAHAADKSYFRLGIVDEGRRGKSKVGTGILVTFREENGQPAFSQITTMNGKLEISIKFLSEKYKFKIREILPPKTAEEMRDVLCEWAKQHREDDDESWKSFSFPDNIPIQSAPIVLLIAMIASSAGVKNINFEMPPVPPNLIWIAPIRTKLRRTYDEAFRSYSSEGSHTPYVIRRMLKSKDGAKKFGDFMEQVGRDSGLFEKIDIHVYGEGDDDRSPFEVDAILDNKALNLRWMGYGVSQSLPIFVELLDRKEGSWFGIQQPEVHLHPRAQACLGDVFFQMANLDKKRFIVETHSDFTIDRFRMNYRGKFTTKQREKLPHSQIIFFERKNGQNTVTPLAIDAHGELPSDQPDSYRNFFIKEQMRLLEL